MIALSVNLNKIALIRNSRDTTNPGIREHATMAIAAGADGITVHPRPDQRHIRASDCIDLAAMLGPDPALLSLRQKLIERTAGNPLFLEESLRTLVEDLPGFTKMEFKESGKRAAETEAAARAAAAEQEAETKRNEEAFALAKTIVAVPEWRGMLPHVRHRSRVEPLMERYYQSHAYKPAVLESFDSPLVAQLGSGTYRQLRVTDAAGNMRIVGFERKEEGGPLTFDWEVFEDVAKWEWQSFREIRPEAHKRMRVAIIRASAAERYYMDSKIHRDQGIAVRIWLRDRHDTLTAIVKKDSELAKEVERLVSWDLGKLVIASLRYPVGSELEDRVELGDILQERWVFEKE